MLEEMDLLYYLFLVALQINMLFPPDKVPQKATDFIS